MTITLKDYRRIEDIQSQPGKEIGLASKMAKLIKDPAKAERRWLAAVSIFGSDHPVTTIFRDRKWELATGSPREVSKVEVSPREVSKVEVSPREVSKVEAVEEVKAIRRTQMDFPIGCNIKYAGSIGKVVEYPEDASKITIECEIGNISPTMETMDVNIYEVKRC